MDPGSGGVFSVVEDSCIVPGYGMFRRSVFVLSEVPKTLSTSSSTSNRIPEDTGVVLTEMLQWCDEDEAAGCCHPLYRCSCVDFVTAMNPEVDTLDVECEGVLLAVVATGAG